MPVKRSALKKLKQDKKRQKLNTRTKRAVKEAIHDYRTAPSKALLEKAFSTLDIAVKKHIYHANKASRLKSRLSVLLKKTPDVKPSASSPAKKTGETVAKKKTISKKGKTAPGGKQ